MHSLPSRPFPLLSDSPPHTPPLPPHGSILVLLRSTQDTNTVPYTSKACCGTENCSHELLRNNFQSSFPRPLKTIVSPPKTILEFNNSWHCSILAGIFDDNTFSRLRRKEACVLLPSAVGALAKQFFAKQLFRVQSQPPRSRNNCFKNCFFQNNFQSSNPILLKEMFHIKIFPGYIFMFSTFRPF